MTVLQEIIAIGLILFSCIETVLCLAVCYYKLRRMIG